jgi:hypothetical protein
MHQIGREDVMLECLVVGDSIGSGVASVMPQCIRMAEVGISSGGWYSKYGSRPALDMQAYKFVVISLGTNDSEVPTATLKKMRDKVIANRVLWILPSQVKMKQRQKVFDLAISYGDIPIDITPYVGPDKIHPPTVEAYQKIAKKIGE